MAPASLSTMVMPRPLPRISRVRGERQNRWWLRPVRRRKARDRRRTLRSTARSGRRRAATEMVGARGVFDGVVEQFRHHLGQFGGVAGDVRGRFRRALQQDCRSAALRGGFGPFDFFLQHRVGIDGCLRTARNRGAPAGLRAESSQARCSAAASFSTPSRISSTRSSSARTPAAASVPRAVCSSSCSKSIRSRRAPTGIAQLVRGVRDQLALGFDAVADGPRHGGEGTAQFPQLRRPVLRKLARPAGCLKFGHCRVQAMDGTQHPARSRGRQPAGAPPRARPPPSRRRATAPAASAGPRSRLTSRTTSPRTWLALPKDREITSEPVPNGCSGASVVSLRFRFALASASRTSGRSSPRPPERSVPCCRRIRIPSP